MERNQKIFLEEMPFWDGKRELSWKFNLNKFYEEIIKLQIRKSKETGALNSLDPTKEAYVGLPGKSFTYISVFNL
ncbi:MAG: hypothetical protein U1F57_09200 [bacterium]